jgi:hypothetical protein
MKKTTYIIATLVLLLLSTSIFATADDYALTQKYKLLNDVKLANKQKEYISNIHLILELNIKEQENFNISKDKFSKILNGLIYGDRTLNLRGTDIKNILAELHIVQKLWEKAQNHLEYALVNSTSKHKAINGLKTINLHMEKAIALYNISYKRYKQHSKLSSIVDRHMNQNRFFALK